MGDDLFAFLFLLKRGSPLKSQVQRGRTPVTVLRLGAGQAYSYSPDKSALELSKPYRRLTPNRDDESATANGARYGREFMVVRLRIDRLWVDETRLVNFQLPTTDQVSIAVDKNDCTTIPNVVRVERTVTGLTPRAALSTVGCASANAGSRVRSHGHEQRNSRSAAMLGATGRTSVNEW
jgi:hypothetical protein